MPVELTYKGGCGSWFLITVNYREKGWQVPSVLG